jgi:hypothetical protein
MPAQPMPSRRTRCAFTVFVVVDGLGLDLMLHSRLLPQLVDLEDHDPLALQQRLRQTAVLLRRRGWQMARTVQH